MTRVIFCLFAHLLLSGSIFSQYINYCTPNAFHSSFDDNFATLNKTSKTTPPQVRFESEPIGSKNFNENGAKVISATTGVVVEFQVNSTSSGFSENSPAIKARETSPIDDEPWSWMKKWGLYPLQEINSTEIDQYSFFSESSGSNFTRSLVYISQNDEFDANHALFLEKQNHKYLSIDLINAEYLSWVRGVSNEIQSFLQKSEVSIHSSRANTSGTSVLRKNQINRKSNISGNPRFWPKLNYFDPFDYENPFKANSESPDQTSNVANMNSMTRNRRAQTMVNGGTYYWEMTDFDDTSNSNDLFIFDGTDTSSYNITIEIASLNPGPPAAPRGTANDDTALGSGPNYQWGTPQNASNSWQNGNPTQSFHFMTIESDTGVIPLSNISVDSRAISYYLGNYWGNWDVSSSLSSDELDTEYRLNYYFEYTGAPEPSTYLMTSALLGLISLNRSTRKSIILLSLRSKQFLLNCVHRVSPNS